MTTSNQRELREAEVAFEQFNANARRNELSRRKVLSGGAALALLASGGMGALLGACGDDDGGATATATSGAPSAATAAKTAAPFAGVTGDWDKTKMPPYKQGLPDDKAKAPEEWKQYPWVYKYGPWRYNWDIPVTRGGQIIVSFPPAANYDVMLSGIAAQMIYNKMFNAALREGVDLTTASIEPDLAIGQEHTPDYTSWTFKVPANAKFHNVAPVNGRLLTAADVQFSFEQHIKGNIQKTALRNISKVTAVDPTTVRFDLKAPMLSLPATLALPYFVIFPKEAFEDPKKLAQQPIGTGPFSLAFSEFGNRADFKRHPEYWQSMPIKQEKYGKAPLPLVDTYTRQAFANNVTAKEAFFGGQVDQFQPGCGVDVNLIKEQLDRVPDAIVNTNAYWSCCTFTFGFNYKNPLFKDIRVRQALSMSINRQEVWEKGMDRTGVIGAGPVPFDFMGYSVPPKLESYGPNAQYNPEKAKALLKEAGVQTPIKLQVYQTPSQPAAWQGGADTVVFNWKQNGIADATMVVRDGQVYTQDMLNKTFPDMFWTIGSLAQGYNVDSLIAPPFRTDSPRNYGSLSDPDLDKLLDDWSVAIDPQKAVEIARKMNQRFVDNMDHLWIGSIGGSEINRAWLHGMVMSVHNCYNGIGMGNYKYAWIDQTAPGGRGGKPVA